MFLPFWRTSKNYFMLYQEKLVWTEKAKIHHVRRAVVKDTKNKIFILNVQNLILHVIELSSIYIPRNFKYTRVVFAFNVFLVSLYFSVSKIYICLSFERMYFHIREIKYIGILIIICKANALYFSVIFVEKIGEVWYWVGIHTLAIFLIKWP